MPRFLSFIFSFDTLQFRSIPRDWFFSIGVAFLLLFAAEVAARLALAPIGDWVWTYWDRDAANKFEWYRAQAERGEGPDLVVIGDSIGARNIDAEALTAQSGMSAINLAWPGNFPLSLKLSTFPLLEKTPPPKLVMVVQSPWSYEENERVRRNESGITSSLLARRSDGEFIAADYIYLARIYPARHWLVDHWLNGRPLLVRPQKLGFMPHIRTGKGATAEPAGDDGRDANSMPDFDQARRATLLELLALAETKGFVVVVLVSPLKNGARPPGLDEHIRWMETVRKDHADVMKIWDLSRYTGLRSKDFKDKSHLWADAAATYSAFLGRLLSQCLTESRLCDVRVSPDHPLTAG